MPYVGTDPGRPVEEVELHSGIFIVSLCSGNIFFRLLFLLVFFVLVSLDMRFADYWSLGRLTIHEGGEKLYADWYCGKKDPMLCNL